MSLSIGLGSSIQQPRTLRLAAVPFGRYGNPTLVPNIEHITDQGKVSSHSLRAIKPECNHFPEAEVHHQRLNVWEKTKFPLIKQKHEASFVQMYKYACEMHPFLPAMSGPILKQIRSALENINPKSDPGSSFRVKQRHPLFRHPLDIV